jgi:hypothetical protein
MPDEQSLISFINGQGIKAAYESEPCPLKCPFPVEEREEVIAWLAGYSLGAIVRRRARTTAGRG